MHEFGGPVDLHAGEAEDGSSPMTAHEDVDLVRHTLLGFNDGGRGLLRVYRPKPTAAFSPRDTTLKSYDTAVKAMYELGFEPVQRRAGGQLAIYDSNALVIDLVAPHEEPRANVMERFRLFSGALVEALMALSVDARIGALAGEYCPGDYSINGGGMVKLAGVAQRIVRRGFHLGAVLSVRRSDLARNAIAAAYGILDMPFDQATFGAIADFAPDLSFATVRKAVLQAMSGLVAEQSSVSGHASPE
jgi:lipoate-protein ligase A